MNMCTAERFRKIEEYAKKNLCDNCYKKAPIYSDLGSAYYVICTKCPSYTHHDTLSNNIKNKN